MKFIFDPPEDEQEDFEEWLDNILEWMEFEDMCRDHGGES